MRRYAVILHPDAELGKRLAAFWSQQKSLGLPVRAFSECSQYAHFRTGAAVEILLFSEHFAEEMQGLIGNSFALLLSEDGFVGEQALNTISVPTLFLYRPADALARSIMALYAKARGDALLSVSRGECEILGIYSPVHRCGKPRFRCPSDWLAQHAAIPCSFRSKSMRASTDKLRRTVPRVCPNSCLPTVRGAIAGVNCKAVSPPSVRLSCSRPFAPRKTSPCSRRKNSHR